MDVPLALVLVEVVVVVWGVVVAAFAFSAFAVVEVCAFVVLVDFGGGGGGGEEDGGGELSDPKCQLPYTSPMST